VGWVGFHASRKTPPDPFFVTAMARISMVRAIGVAGLAIGLGACALATGRDMGDLRPDLAAQLPPGTRAVLEDPEFRVQVLVSHVGTDPSGRARLSRSAYRLGAEYFYPASAVKLAAAVVALQVIDRLGRQHGPVDLIDIPIEIAPLFPGDVPARNDPTNQPSGTITVGHEIRKLSLVSDNQAFNRLFDLVGHDELNVAMHHLGFDSTVIAHRLSDPRTIPDMKASAAVTFHPPHRSPILVPRRTGSLTPANRGDGLRIGSGYLNGGTLVAEPMDFTRRNGMSLVDLQDLLVAVVRPDIDTGRSPLGLTEHHRSWLIDAMTRYPRESDNPVYPATADDALKPLLPGVRRVFPETTADQRVQITNKMGGAYGFTVENAYLHNPATSRAVFVAAVIYTNRDGILNDDRYEYDTIARPFMADLGEMVARRWLRDP
jgi:hypothetical protein